MEDANTRAGTVFPVQKKELIPELIKLRKYYHFDKIPTHWIIKRKPLPSLASVTREIQTFLPNDIKVPIESLEKTKETVKIFRKYYIFKRLNDIFFTSSRDINFSLLDECTLTQCKTKKTEKHKTKIEVPNP